MEYKLLTPGPLTTTMAVKERMLFDHCTWDDDYKQITCRICDGLLLLGHVAAPVSKAVELAFPSDAERCFFTLRSSLTSLT